MFTVKGHCMQLDSGNHFWRKCILGAVNSITSGGIPVRIKNLNTLNFLPPWAIMMVFTKNNQVGAAKRVSVRRHLIMKVGDTLEMHSAWLYI